MDVKQIFISAGHSNVPGKDMGADGLDGVQEGYLTVELRKLIVAELKQLGQFSWTDPDYLVTRESVTIISTMLHEHDVAIDIHFNAYHVPEAKGTEVLIPFNASNFEKTLATKLCNEIANCLGTKNRGVKTEAQSAHGRLIFMRPKCENILLEICFITNRSDLDAYNNKKGILAKIIAKILFNSLQPINKDISNPITSNIT